MARVDWSLFDSWARHRGVSRHPFEGMRIHLNWLEGVVIVRRPCAKGPSTQSRRPLTRAHRGGYAGARTEPDSRDLIDPFAASYRRPHHLPPPPPDPHHTPH